MNRRGAMQDVELEDASSPVERAVPSRPRARRRWWWAGGVAVVTVAALVGTQAVIDARQRAAVARFASVPGVVTPVGSGVGVLWTPDAAVTSLVLEGVQVGGAFVGLSVADDGSQAVLAVDARTGRTRWSTQMFGPDGSAAQSFDRRVAGHCAPVPAATVTQVACLVSDDVQQIDREAGRAVVPSTSTRVVVLDAADGRIVADRPADGATALAVLPGLAVVHVPGDDVTGRDLVTGATVWHYTPPGVGRDLSQAAFSSSVRLFTAGDLVGVAMAGWSVALLSPTGEVVRAPHPADASYSVDPLTGTLALLTTTGSGRISSTLVRTGRDDVALPGGRLGIAVDDGSVPGLVLTSDASLRGWDDRTGALRWTSDQVATSDALVLRGKVYISTTAGTVALDGRTGEIVWRTTVTPGHVPGSLATDGTHLLLADQPIAGDDASELDAYGLDDGRVAWRAPLPAGVRSSTSVGRVLLGLTSDGVVVLG